MEEKKAFQVRIQEILAYGEIFLNKIRVCGIIF